MSFPSMPVFRQPVCVACVNTPWSAVFRRRSASLRQSGSFLFVKDGRRFDADRLDAGSSATVARRLPHRGQSQKPGYRRVILFGIPSKKDPIGSSAMSDEGIVARAVKTAKDAVGDDLLVVTDVCSANIPITVIAVSRRRGNRRSITTPHSNLVLQTLVHARAGSIWSHRAE